MKFFFALVVFNVVLAINAKEIDSNLAEKCLKELEIDQEAFKAALEKKAEDVDMSVKCMSKCMLKEKKMINEDGEFDVQQIAASLFMEPENVEVAKPFIESCLKGGEKDAEKKQEGEEKDAEKKEEGEEKGAEKKEEKEVSDAEKKVKREAKKEPSCEEAYEMMMCVSNKIEEALKDN